jgi:hypothetical protein
LRRSDFDARTLRRVFCRIVEEIEQHLLHQHHIGLDHRQIWFEIDFDLVVLQDLRGPLNGGADDVGKVDRSALGGKRPGLQPRHVEEIANEPVKPFRLLLNGAQ